jgi:hypothetical protein
MEATQPPPQENPPPPHRWKLPRWAIWTLAGVAGIFLIVCLSFTAIVGMIIRHELKSQVAANLNATLDIDTLSYQPFLGAKIGRAELTTPGPDGSAVPVIELSGLQVNLARLPWGGPILIENCTIHDPTIDLVELPSGELQIEQNFLKPSTTPSGKLSDVLQIQHFTIDNLQVRWSDWKSSSPPKLLGTLNLTAEQSSPGVYTFNVAASDKPLAEMKVAGSINVDGTALSFKDLSATAQVPQANDLGSLPPALQAFCTQYKLAGIGLAMTVADGGNVAIDMGKSRWRIKDLRGTVKVTSSPPTETASGQFDWSLNGGGALPGTQSAAGMNFLADLDPDTHFSLNSVANGNFTLRGPQWPQPLSNMVTAVEYSNRTLTIKQISGQYGQQAVKLQAALALQSSQVNLQQFRLDLANGGVFINSATFDLNQPHDYTANIVVERLDLRQLKQFIPIDDPQGRISGLMDAKLNVKGSMPAGKPPLADAGGDGRFHVSNGDFLDIKILNDIVSKVVPGAQGAARVGDAAGVFTLGNESLKFSKVAVSCPIIGIQGDGSIGLVNNNPVDLNLMVVPIANLKKDVDKANIPVVGQLFGQVAGVAQNAFTQVTQQVVVSFHVTGPADSPTVQAVPAPALQKGASDLFGQMVNGINGAKGNLLDLIQPDDQKEK